MFSFIKMILLLIISVSQQKRIKGKMLGRCPKGFKLIEKLPKGKVSVCAGMLASNKNPYTKDNFVEWESESGDENYWWNSEDVHYNCAMQMYRNVHYNECNTK